MSRFSLLCTHNNIVILCENLTRCVKISGNNIVPITKEDLPWQERDEQNSMKHALKPTVCIVVHVAL